MLNQIIDNNPYFNAGFGLAVIGVGYRFISRFSNVAKTIIKKRLFISLEVTNNDPAFRWILNFVQKSPGIYANQVTANTLTSNSKDYFHFSPSPGSHYMLYEKRLFLVERNRETTSLNINTGVPFESVKFTTFGRNKDILTRMLLQSQKEANKIFKDTTVLFVPRNFSWEEFGHPKSKRSLDSVILPKETKSDIIRDIWDFQNSKEWYLSKGIPYRRTYLFYGPPGSGKTSFISALAGHFAQNISIVNLNEGMSDEQFEVYMSCIPKNSFVVIEDIDSIFENKKADPNSYRKSISYSGVLNVLDGVISSEERIIFMTTNHIERLDKALIRPGRVDTIQYFGNASKEQTESIFLKFFPGRVEESIQFSKVARGKSMAELQGILMKNRISATKAAEDAAK